MSEIDWGKAPEGATHARIDDPKHPFRKVDKDGCWYAWVDDSSRWAVIGVIRSDQRFKYIPRPELEANTWNGEGLPPVGTICEMWDPAARIWGEVEVVFVSALTVVVRITSGDHHAEWARQAREDEFRPLRTPEQIAADERFDRVHAIEGIMLRGQELALTITQIAAAIDDAGYRKVEGGAE